MFDIFKEENEKFERFGELFNPRAGQIRYKLEIHAFTGSLLSSSFEVIFIITTRIQLSNFIPICRPYQILSLK
jgi:hypothetical protein